MASPEALAIRDAEHKERQSSAMEAIQASQERIESKLDAVLEQLAGSKPKPKTN